MTGRGGHIPNNAHFVVYTMHVHQCQILYKLIYHLEPMAFPLLLPDGDPGYTSNIVNIASSQ